MRAVINRIRRANVKEIPVIDAERHVIADITMVDLLRRLLKSPPSAR